MRERRKRQRGFRTQKLCLMNPKTYPIMDSISRKPAKKTEIFKALPEVWQLIRPRRALLALGLGLMVINRVSGLVLPASTKYLVDDVIS